MKILVTGSTGLIGSVILRLNPGVPTVGTYYYLNRYLPDVDSGFVHLDVTNPKEIEEVFEKEQPTHVVHTAAMGSPDWCENNKELSYGINVEGTRNIIHACQKHESKLIFFSSNIVFDGNGAPYNEESLVHPLSEYGRQKVESEKDIQSSGLSHTIIRTMCVYGWSNPYERRNFVTLLLTKNMLGEHMDVTDDIICNFISAHDIALFTWIVIKGFMKERLYHVVGTEALTHWDVAKKMIPMFSLKPELLAPVSSVNLKDYFSRVKDNRFTTLYDTGFVPMSIDYGLNLMKENPIGPWRWV